jgi:hypothetical protein
MVAELRKTNRNLYETDYNLWVLQTATKLKNKDLDDLDWKNLIEEVEDLSRRDRQKLASLLTRLFEHFLKLAYWESEKARNQNHWQGEITNFRIQIKRVLKDSPSLRPHLEDILRDCYQDGRKVMARRSGLRLEMLPENPIANLEQTLDENWLP